MAAIYSFGEWVKQQRKRLRLTQNEVAARTHCTLATIKKIEPDQRRPSTELAGLLAQVLQIPPAQHDIFIQCTRGQRPVDALVSEPPLPVPALPIALAPCLCRRSLSSAAPPS